MNKNTSIIIGIVAIVLIAGGVYASMSNNNDAMMEKEKMEQQAMEDKAMMEKEMMKDDTAMADDMKKDDAMMKTGSYEAYSADKLARAESGDVVVFFHASWCPSCRALNTALEGSVKSIPEGVSILKADYDKETELKKKYGVTSQHTLVQVDAQGNMIKKWSGGSSLDAVLSNIQ